jgi:hypothetical protein
LLSVCTQGYGSAPHAAWCYTQPSFFGAPWLSLDFMRWDSANSVCFLSRQFYVILLCKTLYRNNGM